MVMDSRYEDLSSFRGIELESEIARLTEMLAKSNHKVTSVTNEKIDLFNRWSRGQTFEEWQSKQRRNNEIEKEAQRMKDASRSQVSRDREI